MVNRIKNRLIAGTATDIPLQHIFQLFIRRLRHFSQQRRGTHQYARSTKTALHAAFPDKWDENSWGWRLAPGVFVQYGERFEKEMMDLTVNIPLEAALDLGWQIMAECFDPEETGISSKLTGKFWPQKTA